MSVNNNDLKLKLAWQTAYEQRTCPDNMTLHSSETNENLKTHLDICHVCREKRDMRQGERNAWKTLREKFATIAMKPGKGTEKQVGQVWTIKKEFGGWREDGRFIRPPSVLLIEKVEVSSGWRVVQLFNDKRLMANGDIALTEQYGFAETWNCYSLKDDRFDNCLGAVQANELEQVVVASASIHDPAPEGSIHSFFRSMEIEVGAYVAVPAVMKMVEEWESSNVEVFELIPGLKLAISGTKDFVLDITAGTLDLLRGTFSPEVLVRSASTPEKAKLPSEQKILVKEHCPVIPIKVEVVDDVLTVTLKWLHEKPAESFRLRVVLNGVEFTDEKFIRVVGNKIRINHLSFIADRTQITSIKLSYLEDMLCLDISCVNQ